MGLLIKDLVSFWELEEASGTRVDRALSANDLTDINTVTQNPGKVGQAAQFTIANSEYLDRATNPGLYFGNYDQTIAAWVYLDAKATFQVISANTGSVTGFGHLLRYNQTNDRYQFLLFDSAGLSCFGVLQADNFGSPGTATWHFVVAWFDAAAGIGYISVNNGPFNSATKSSDPVAETTFPFTIGSFSSPEQLHYWGGRIDQYLYAKRVLTAAERTWLYNNNNGRSWEEIKNYPIIRMRSPLVAAGNLDTEDEGHFNELDVRNWYRRMLPA